MRGLAAGILVGGLMLSGCDDDDYVVVPADEPAPPVAVQASYYAGVVTVSWELSSQWNEEAFRVYSKRTTDTGWFFIAEVTSCAAGFCSYSDANVVSGVSYLYYVAAVDPVSGFEAASGDVSVFVPEPVPPPVPADLQVVALDDAVFVKWGDGARAAADFSFYRVYIDAGGGVEYFLGDTDSEGFLDLLAANGETYTYFVTSVDDQGHESGASLLASGTPRPDFHGEYVYDYFDQPTISGFRFQPDETTNPVLDGDAVDRHFRFEVDVSGFWLVPGPGTTVHPNGVATTALKCGVAADASCVDATVAPTSGYVTGDLGLATQTSYFLRVVGDDGLAHYAVLRVELLGTDQDGNDLMIFDWAYQLQPNNPSLSTRVDVTTMG